MAFSHADDDARARGGLDRATEWWRAGRLDRTRARTTVLYQTLFGLAVLVSTLVAFVEPDAVEVRALIVGALATFVVTGASLIIPWNRIAAPWSALVPIADIVIVGVLREASSTVGFSFLWIFPAMWLASSFMLLGLFAAVVLIPAIYWASLVAEAHQGVALMTLLIPLTICTAAVSAYMTARRAEAQRSLLEDQARQLARAFSHARAQEDLVTQVLDAVDFGVIRLSTDGRTEFTNLAQQRFERGLAELDLGGVAVFESDGITPLCIADDPIVRARAGAAFEQCMIWYGAPGEKRIALSITARRMVEDGVDAGALIVSQDVTAEVLALRARDDLVASVSHELRTPLTSILGYVDLVLDDDLSPSARRGVEVIERNGTRLLTMVSEILTSAREGAIGADLRVDPTDVDVADVVHAAVEAAVVRATDRGLTIDVSGVESAFAWADGLRMRQVLDNLIGNAIAYHDRADGMIWVGSTFDGDHTWIVVRDDGPGIGSEDQQHIFERFFRADAVRGSTAHGSGLGLSISRELVRAQGGELTVQSELGAGSSFVVRLPQSRPEGVA